MVKTAQNNQSLVALNYTEIKISPYYVNLGALRHWKIYFNAQPFPDPGHGR